MMRRYIVPLALFVCFIVEGTLMEWIIPGLWQSQIYVVPHLVLTCVLYIALFQNRYLALTYGLAFGILQDINYYGHALGVHSFSMGLVGYAVGLAFRGVRPGLVMCMLAMALGNLFYDALVYGIYAFFLHVTRATPEWTFVRQMLPSMLISLLFALLLYVPVRKWLETRQTTRQQEEK